MSPATISRSLALAFAFLLAARHVSSQDPEPTGPTMPNIAPNCNAFHTVVAGAGEGCWSVSNQYGISLDDFFTWNPDVSSDCGTNFWAGYAYCVGVGDLPSTTDTTVTSGTTSTETSSSSITTAQTTNTEPYSTRHPITEWDITSTAVATAFPPEKTQPGQPVDCRDWKLVGSADTCDSIVASSSWLTKQQLLEWNPALGTDCSGLYVGWWVCVMVRVRTVTDTFSWITTDTPANIPTLTGEYTPTPFPSIDDDFTASPTQTGIVEGCKSFHFAEPGNTCRDIVDGHFLKMDDFFAWNPALNSNCDGLWAGYWYCVVGPEGITAMPPTVTATPTNLPPGQPPNCNSWYQRDGETCDGLVGWFGIFSLAEFISWNPSVGPDCSNLIDGTWYCVGIPGTPTTRTSPTSTKEWPMTPTQSNIAANCSKLWLVGVNDSCSSIAVFNQITEGQFFDWNPTVGTSECDNLVLNFYVCVAVEGSSSAAAAATAPTSVAS